MVALVLDKAAEDAQELDVVDPGPAFLIGFPADGLLQCLAAFDATPGEIPFVLVAVLNQQDLRILDHQNAYTKRHWSHQEPVDL